MTDARVAVERVLDGLVASGTIVAGLVGRDGLPLVVRASRPAQEETFSAMAAAMLAASEAALQEVAAAAQPTVVVARSGALELGVGGVDDDHLLACIAPAGTSPGALRKRIEDASRQLHKALGG